MVVILAIQYFSRPAGFQERRRSATILAEMSAAANAVHGSAPDDFFATGVAAVVGRVPLIGVGGSSLIQRDAPRNSLLYCKPTKSHPFIRVGTRSRGHSSSQRWSHMVPSDACSRRRLEGHSLVNATRDLKDLRFADRAGQGILDSVAAITKTERVVAGDSARDAQEFIVARAAALGSRLHLAGPLYYEQFLVGALQKQWCPCPARQFRRQRGGFSSARSWMCFSRT